MCNIFCWKVLKHHAKIISLISSVGTLSSWIGQKLILPTRVHEEIDERAVLNAPVLLTVAHNCHGKSRNLTPKTKYLTAKPKTSQNFNINLKKCLGPRIKLNGLNERRYKL